MTKHAAGKIASVDGLGKVAWAGEAAAIPLPDGWPKWARQVSPPPCVALIASGRATDWPDVGFDRRFPVPRNDVRCPIWGQLARIPEAEVELA